MDNSGSAGKSVRADSLVRGVIIIQAFLLQIKQRKPHSQCQQSQLSDLSAVI
jgi:hypothetical protein